MLNLLTVNEKHLKKFNGFWETLNPYWMKFSVIKGREERFVRLLLIQQMITKPKLGLQCSLWYQNLSGFMNFPLNLVSTYVLTIISCIGHSISSIQISLKNNFFPCRGCCAQNSVSTVLWSHGTHSASGNSTGTCQAIRWNSWICS